MSHQQDFITEETLEEGRVALYRLERQLKEQHSGYNPATDNRDNRSENSSKQQSVSSERRLLDQLPRITRLNQRLESLGLTVEELDDRGLLDGGGSVPSYYTSMKQKNRRTLELQPRSHRLQERGKEALSKMLNNLFHMLRVLTKKGLNLEDYFRSLDPDRKGLLHRKQLYVTLKQLGLPFNSKELQDVVHNYTEPSTDRVDYISFLKDSRLANKKSAADGTRGGGGYAEEGNIGSYTSILTDVKRMLLHSIKSYNKHPDEIYRTFARWDTQGTGTVTGTQFLRVLARLHVELSDQDQDFLVDLLDTNGMGRIDFDSLLSYCFASLEPADPTSPSPQHHGIIVGTAIGFDDAAGETLSAVSLDGNTSLELKSTNSNPGYNKRPHTASMSRPYGGNNKVNTADYLNTSADNMVISNPSSSGKGRMEMATPGSGSGNKNKSRPLTASARVSSGQHTSATNVRGHEAEEGLMVMDLPDDVIHGEEKFLPNQHHQHQHQHHSQPQQRMAGNNNGYHHNGFMMEDNNNNDRVPYGHTPASSSGNNPPKLFPPQSLGRGNNNTDDQGELINEDLSPMEQNGSGPSTEPADHLVLLANQILTTLRDIIMARYRRGRGLREIYQHFDRDGKGYFDALDFIQATADLRIEVSEKVAIIAIQQLAIDGYSQVSFGEFKVFVLDSDHHLLELTVQEQMSHLFEQQGREYANWMVDMFWTEEETLSESRVSGQVDRQNGMISKNAFINALKRIGLVLTTSEVSRLMDRFDINGTEQCSAIRFIEMVQSSAAWRHAEAVLVYQDQAVHEAASLRQQLQKGVKNSNMPDLSEELISMCEYLGIRVISEPNMIWIAADALKAPLPVNWTAEKDASGRTFFYNHLTNQSRWEHPLDPHFRNLRDRYRQSNIGTDTIDLSNVQSTLKTNIADGRNRVITSKAPTLEADFPSKPLPPAHAINRNTHIITNKNRPQSAVEYTMYHNPNKVTAAPSSNNNNTNNNNNNNNNNSSSTRQKLFTATANAYPTATHNGMEEEKDVHNMMFLSSNASTEKGKRPLSAPQHKQPQQHLHQHPGQQSNTNFPPMNTSSNNNATGSGAAAFNPPVLKHSNTANNAAIFNQSKNIVEQIYSAPYFKNIPSVPHPRVKSASYNRPSTANNTSNSSSNNNPNPASQQQQMSAVDRALSIGKTLHHTQQQDGTRSSSRSGARRDSKGNSTALYLHGADDNNRAMRLNEMLEGNIIEKLDNVLAMGGSNNNGGNR